MLFISFSIVALSLVYASPTPNGISKNEAVSASKLGLPEKFAIPVTISNAATRGSLFVTDGASEADVQVAASGIDNGLYGVWSRYQVDTDTWVFKNRATHKWLSINETTNRLVTAEHLAPTIFAVDHAGGPGIQLVIKMPNADQVWQEVHTGSCSHVELKPARGQNSQHWVYS